MKKEELDYNLQLRKEVEVLDILLTLIIIALSIIALVNYNFFKAKAAAEIVIYGELGLFFISIILDFIPQLFDPGFGVFVAMASGISLFQATVIIILGSMVGGLLGYEVGRMYGLRVIAPLFSKKSLENTLGFFKKYGKYLVMFGALTPLPYFPILFGALKMERKEFWLWGLLPRAMSFIIFALAIRLGITLWQGL